MFLPRGPYLPLQHNSLCTSIKQEHCHLLGASVCSGPEVRMQAGVCTVLCVCVCVYAVCVCVKVLCSALRVSLPGATRCAVLTVAGEQCYGPWQLVKDSTITLCCAQYTTHLSTHTHTRRKHFKLTQTHSCLLTRERAKEISGTEQKFMQFLTGTAAVTHQVEQNSIASTSNSVSVQFKFIHKTVKIRAQSYTVNSVFQ